MIKRVFGFIVSIVKKVALWIKLKDMDFFAEFTGMSSWMLFPPSFYYTHTEEEIKEATEEARQRMHEILDRWEQEEKEAKEKEQARADAERSASD